MFLPDVLWLDELSEVDVAAAGAKGAHLGELMAAGFAVPAGFVLTTSGFRRAVERSDGGRELRRLMTALPADDPEALLARSQKLAEIAREVDLPGEMAATVLTAYQHLSGGAPVAVRSSPACPLDGGEPASGVYATFTWVAGGAAVLDGIRACWTSLFTDRAVAGWALLRRHHEPSMAVVVQKAVAADSAGVACTADLATGDLGSIVVHAVIGLGGSVTSDVVVPDRYVLGRRDLDLRSVYVGDKRHKLTGDRSGGVTREALSPEQAGARALADDQATRVAELARQVSALYRRPMTIEWAFDGDDLWLLEAYPPTFDGTVRAGTSAVVETSCA